MDDLVPDQNLAYRARMLAESARSLEGILSPRASKRAKETTPERAGEWQRTAGLLVSAAAELAGAAATLTRIAEERPDLYIRTGDFVGLRSGGLFFPLDPRPDEVTVEDMAHALWRKGRWNGHASRLVSSGEHALRASWGADALARAERLPFGIVLLASKVTLLHDGSDAYLPDISTPLKPFIPGWHDIEEAVQRAVYLHFGIDGIPIEVWEIVEQADFYMKVIEAQRFFSDAARARWGDWVRTSVPAHFEAAAWGEEKESLVTEETFRELLQELEDVTKLAKRQDPPAEVAAPTPSKKAWRDDGAKVSADAFEPPAHLRGLLGDGK